MKTFATTGKNLNILKAASRIARKADVHPQRIERKVRNIIVILIFGVVGAVVAFIAIRMGLPPSEKAKLVTAFLMFCSLAVIVASAFAILVVIWNAYVFQYVQSLESKVEAEQATSDLTSFLDGVTKTIRDPEYDKELVCFVLEQIELENISQKTPESQIDKIVQEKTFGETLISLIFKHLKTKSEVASNLYEEIKKPA